MARSAAVKQLESCPTANERYQVGQDDVSWIVSMVDDLAVHKDHVRHGFGLDDRPLLVVAISPCNRE